MSGGASLISFVNERVKLKYTDKKWKLFKMRFYNVDEIATKQDTDPSCLKDDFTRNDQGLGTGSNEISASDRENPTYSEEIGPSSDDIQMDAQLTSKSSWQVVYDFFKKFPVCYLTKGKWSRRSVDSSIRQESFWG